MIRVLWLGVLVGCVAPEVRTEVELSGFEEVVPARMPEELGLLPANNNLDITLHEGRYWLAFRNAPTHFASAETRMIVVSSADEQVWRVEDVIAEGRDVREPHLVSADGELYLHYALLGTSPIDFEPGGSLRARWDGDAFVDAEPFGPEGFIPWRIKHGDGSWQMFGYTGGGEVYDNDGDAIHIHWFESDDAVQWHPVDDEQGIVLSGGGSETDAVWLSDGRLVAVVRNEAGDGDGFGSKICTAPPGDRSRWTCTTDLRKFDSPLVFLHQDRVWLVARRNVTETGHYDLQLTDLDRSDQYLRYQADYWGKPKRCALWEVRPDTRTVEHVLDLPSSGDTCFAEAIWREDHWLLYNYSSDPTNADQSWLEGQQGPTMIHRMELRLPGVISTDP